MKNKNLLKNIPDNLSQEVFQSLFNGHSFRVERIISNGQITPEDQWYDQDDDEWVLLLQGHATLIFENESQEYTLKTGDTLHIPAHKRHRVSWTDPEQETIWLAIYYTSA